MSNHLFNKASQEKEIDKIVKELDSVYDNIKAEQIIIELQKSSLIGNDFIIENKSSFSRPYRRDVIKSKKIDSANKLLLELSRNGIYDSLPEGFFHSNNEANGTYNAKRKKKKDEEKSSRLFFSPIENELFNQSINIKKKEKELFDNFYDFDNDFFLNFWDLKKHISNRYIIKLVKLLPHCHKVAGDLGLTKSCLSQILGEKVSITKTFESETIKHPQNSNIQTLGIDFVAKAKKTSVAIPRITVKIGPVDSQKLEEYYENEEILKFLKIFYSYFIPLEFQVKTLFCCNENQKFILNENEKPIMGVSTNI